MRERNKDGENLEKEEADQYQEKNRHKKGIKDRKIVRESVCVR